MRPILLGLAAIGLVTAGNSSSAEAQTGRRRPITIVFRQTPVSKVQWSADSGNAPIATVDGGDANGGGEASPPGILPNDPENAKQASSDVLNAGLNGQSLRETGPRPTLQQLQNASGSYLFSQTGMSQTPFTTVNNSTGTQFNNWNNLRSQPAQLDAFESFNRSQPPSNWGGYVSPNNYTGSMNNSWSNLSSGSISPNYLGGWNYQR